MSTYNTGNPVGSVDVKDLYDNAQNLDRLVNDRTVAQYPDRLGNPRKTWSGIEQDFNAFLQNSQFEYPPLTYVDGTPLTVLRSTQTIQRAGQLYRVRLPASFPVNLTGTWATDEPLLTPMSDAVLRQDLAGPTGATFVTYKSPLASSIARSLSDRLNDYVSVKDFGAVGNGTTDDRAAFQAAFDASSRVFVPPGTYRLSGALTVTNRDFSLVGSGKDVSVLLWTSATNGIEFTDSTGIASQTRATLTVESMTLAAGAVAAGKAIYMLMSVTPVPAVYGDATTLTLRDVDIRGQDQYGANTQYWTKALHLVDTGGVFVDNVRIFAVNAIAGSMGIHIEVSTASNVRFIMQGLHIAFCEYGILLQGKAGMTLEGIYLSGFEIVACMWGIRCIGGLVHALELTGGHIDTDAECISYAVTSANSSTLAVVGCYLQRGKKARGTAIGGYILDLNTVHDVRVSACYILGDATVSHYGAVTTAASSAIISSNTIQDCTGAGVIFDAASANCRAAVNNFLNVATPYSVSGTSNFADRSGANFVSHANGVTHIFGDQLVTLNASGIGTLTFPSGLAFRNSILAAVVSNGDPGAVAGAPGCKLASSTTSTLFIQVTPNPGAVTIRVGYHAIGN